MTRSTWFIITSQFLLFLGLCLCFAILPQFLESQSGVSNYGVHLATVLPYSLAFIIAAAGAIAAGHFMPRNTHAAQFLAKMLYALGVIFIIVLLSTYPYQVGDPYRNLHVAAGALLYIVELIVAIWLTFFIRRDLVNGILFGLQIAGALVSFISFIRVTNLLLLGQMLAGLSFAILVARGTHIIANHHQPSQEPWTDDTG